MEAQIIYHRSAFNYEADSMTSVKGSFTISEAHVLSGLSITMLDYLCRTKIVIPSSTGRRGRGRQRLFSFGDVVLLRVVGRLLSAGVSVLRMKRAFQSLQKLHPEITPTTLPASHLVTDGSKLFLRQRTDILEELESGQLAFMFVLELSTIKDEVLKQLRVEQVSEHSDEFHYELKRKTGTRRG